MRGRIGAVRRWYAEHRRVVRRSLLALVAGVVLLGGGGTLASVVWIRGDADDHIYSEARVPDAPVALVLGTKVDADGEPSPFLAARLEIARRLFDAGKVRAILVSGDNMNADYDEPGAMMRWLVDRGVPAQQVVLDHAGFDTYDSCARAERIFGVKRATVVTQSFHLPRAVALCRRLGIDASGVGDETVKRYGRPWRVSSTREYGACLKAALDLLSGRDPVHLGRRETGVDDALRKG
ncbi:SanA/YdcF family protein [Micromonospora cremea]|uniref:Protein SanA, affects membrane permeability for vancomycin n=1 Tax=Micromonospora cremea TaxID=709881 RepID=A0A1N5WFV2_9ACTN|nr:ElyC/SanA/YdcF family protein [Micromonospora cremea]SIM84081.1 protein SanA, affects membrane permeability for vancomycin [Micromonospora cremea]